MPPLVKVIWIQIPKPMDFKDQILQLGERAVRLRENLLTEEATKNALVLPFIQCLGYDVFNPSEVLPEFIADIGIKKGEKVDYAIMRDGKPCILIECKHINQDLNLHNSQLFRYFHTTSAKFSILTNGMKYKFFTDLAEPNKMDEKPFLEFDLANLKEEVITEVKKFHRSYFDVEQISHIANELKYCNEIRNMMIRDISSPSETLVKYYISNVYQGRATEKVLQQFSAYVIRTNQQVINDTINERLKLALAGEQTRQEEQQPEQTSEPKIITTAEEIEGYFVVKAILRQHVDPTRICYRDAQSYFSVLLDDNNRKTICRLYLSGNKKYIGVFDEKRNEVRKPITGIDDIYHYTTELCNTLKGLLQQPETFSQNAASTHEPSL